MADSKTRGLSADRKRLNKSEPHEVAYAKSDRASPARKSLLGKSGAAGSKSSGASKSGGATKGGTGTVRSSVSSARKSGSSAGKSGAATKKSATASGTRKSSASSAGKSSSTTTRGSVKSASPAMKRTNAAPARKTSRTTTRATPNPPKAEKTTENTAPRTMREADAVDLLTDDHLEVGALFKQYDKLAKKEAPAGERKMLAQTICDMLKAHTTIEEEIFYPAARRAGIDADLLDEADIEHASAKDLIAQIEAGNADGDHYDAKVKVLGEYITHHVVEEHTEMFTKCRRSKMDLIALRGEMEARKLALVPDSSEAASGGQSGDEGKAKSPGILASLFSKA